MTPSPHGSVTLSDPSTWQFDIDRYINPFVPAPRWHLVPKPVARMLGHREESPKPVGNIPIAFWSLVGAFCGVALVASVSKRVPSFEARGAPAIIGSFGAAAVLEFCAIESPFAQPRNAITVGLGWFLIPVMLLGVTLMVAAAVVINNVQRRYPLYWWTSHPLAVPRQDLEEIRHEKPPSFLRNYEDSLTDVPRRLVVERGDISVPDGVTLSAEETEVLEKISERL
ncbi:hypothetical protein N7499_001995 [Penicillium canescens]|nr:hypothetical protein N7499_001995 [Penicillium canescens]